MMSSEMKAQRNEETVYLKAAMNQCDRRTKRHDKRLGNSGGLSTACSQEAVSLHLYPWTTGPGQGPSRMRTRTLVTCFRRQRQEEVSMALMCPLFPPVPKTHTVSRHKGSMSCLKIPTTFPISCKQHCLPPANARG